MTWTREGHIAQMKPHADKLIKYLHPKGIDCLGDDGRGNIMFSDYNETTGIRRIIKISHHSFYRFSGISVVYKHHSDHEIEAIKVTDAMFMENFMKPIIEQLFK